MVPGGMTEQGSVAAPPVPAFAVERAALVDRLERGCRRRLALLVAPAGYGKSVLLGQWAAAHPERRIAWVRARPTDDALDLAARILDALVAAAPLPGDAVEPLDGVSPASFGALARSTLQAELAARAPVTVVVDDVEALAGGELRGDLVRLADGSAEGVGIVLASREDWFPGIEALRLRGEVAEIRQAALCFSPDEVAELIPRIGGPNLGGEVLEALHARTEGWPAGVQLAAIGLRDQDDPERFVAEFAGDDRHVADYLSDEVLAHQTPEVTDFLLRTALLDRLCGPLCDALTGRHDGQRVLERMESWSLFLQPLDHRREWFAYHPMFRDLLRYHLRATAGPLVEELLQTAAAWHLERGEVDEAAGYLIRAEDWDGVLRLADVHGASYFAQGQSAAVQRWLEAVPAERRRGDVDATVALAAALTLSGRVLASEDLVHQIEEQGPLPTWAVGVLAVLRGAWTGFHLRPEAAAEAHAVIDTLDDEALTRPGGPILGLFTPATERAVCVGTHAIACSLLGDYEQARALLTRVEAAPGSSVWLVHSLAERAYVEASTGRLRSATSHVQRALAVADETGLARHPATAMAHFAQAHVHRLRGRSVGGHVDAALARARVNDRNRALAVGWGARAHDAFLAGRAGDGLTILDQAEAHGGPPPPPVELARRHALRLRLLLAAGQPAEARALADLGGPGPLTSEVAAAVAAVAASTADVPALRKAVDGWAPVDADEPIARWQRGLWTAVLEDLDGDRSQALRTLRAVTDETAPEDLREPFLHQGDRVRRLVQALARQQPTAYLEQLSDATPVTGRVEVPELVEQLTEREMEVLAYLPSRLSNASIAAQLYVSINTQKTHTKNIYRKLGVGGREEAVNRAMELGLL